MYRRIVAAALDILWHLGAGSLTRSNSSYALGKHREDDPVRSRLPLLRSLLRRFPYWLRGHLRLAEESLTIDDIITAYSSAHCIIAGSYSTRNTPLRAEGYLLMGRACLRRGDWRSCLKHLQTAAELLPGDSRILEEEAAAYMAGDERARALTILQTIPSRKLSVAGRAALEFLLTSRNG